MKPLTSCNLGGWASQAGFLLRRLRQEVGEGVQVVVGSDRYGTAIIML
jgi:hypothetical protein